MNMTVDALVEKARAIVSTREPEAAHGKLILDVREPGELVSDGALEKALHIPRGLLEFKADPASEKAHDRLTAARSSGEPVHVLCASGQRATLAAATLARMGYSACVIEGGLKGWKDAGLPVVRGQ